MTLRELLRFTPAVEAALREARPVVALESTVIAHGLPRPLNLETARACEADVRAERATPATLAIAAGVLRVGVDEALLEALATRDDVRKASTRDIAPLLASKSFGATTVAASVEIAALAGIAVFSTGGIGGVHRGAERTDDVSADLGAIARWPVCVVCAGAKMILDLVRTLERLETLGVPVVTVAADEFPAFTVRASGVPSPHRVDSIDEVTAIARLRFAQGGGLVVALPIDATHALPADRAERALADALAEAERRGVRGDAVTPFLLRAVAEREREALAGNVAVLRANARFAARLARALLG